MTNRTKFSSTVTLTAREVGAINRIIQMGDDYAASELRFQDEALVVSVLRDLISNLSHETRQEETPPLLRPDLPGQIPSQNP